jgi:hypothetical protein
MQIKRPLRLKSLRKTLRKRNPIHTTGSAKSIVIRNGTPTVKAIHWGIDYDGSKATGRVDVQNQDSIYKYNVNLDNRDLDQLLSTPTVAIPIDQRLRETFDFRVGAMDSAHNNRAFTSSFNDYVHPSFVTTRMDDRSYQSNRSLRKKYRVTPYPHNATKSLRKRKGVKPRMTHINQ